MYCFFFIFFCACVCISSTFRTEADGSALFQAIGLTGFCVLHSFLSLPHLYRFDIIPAEYANYEYVNMRQHSLQVLKPDPCVCCLSIPTLIQATNEH